MCHTTNLPRILHGAGMLVDVHKSFWISFTASHWWIDKSETEVICYPQVSGETDTEPEWLVVWNSSAALHLQSGRHVLKSVLHGFYV